MFLNREKLTPRVGSWEGSEVATLKTLVGTIPIKQIARRLNRTPSQVSHMVGKLGLARKRTKKEQERPRWTAEDVEFLVRNYASKSAGYIGEHLQRTPEAVRDKARKLGIKKFKRKLWDEAEDDLLFHSQRMPAQEVAELLSRTVGAVQVRKSQLRRT